MVKPSNEPVIAVENLCFNYPNGNQVFRDLSLKIYQGQFIAMMGKNGSGKTTLVKHFNGLLKPTSGQVWVKQYNTKEVTTAQLASEIGYLWQNPQLQICTNSVTTEVAFALKIKKRPAKEIEEKVGKLLAQLKLTSVAKEHPYRLSKAQLQRVALASSIINEPPILVVDEPTSLMSGQDTREIMEFLAQYHRQGNTIIMITHDLSLAYTFAQRLIIMEKGEIILDLPIDQCLQEQERLKVLGFDLAEVEGGESCHEAFVGLQ